MRGIHRSQVNSPHKGQWRGALMFSLIWARINIWVNNGEAGDLRRQCAHYDVIVIYWMNTTEILMISIISTDYSRALWPLWIMLSGHRKMIRNCNSQRELEERHSYLCSQWWRHQMEAFSALLALCVGNSPVTGEFPTQRPVTRSFDVFLICALNKRLSKQSWSWWSETPSRSLWCHCNDDDLAHFDARTQACLALEKWYV